MVLSLAAKAQVISHGIDPKGAYKDIQVAADNDLIKSLANAKEAKQAVLIQQIISEPNKHNPVVLYALSAVLFNTNRKDEAAYWFYLAQLRTRYDFNRCTDKTTSGSVAQLNGTFGPQINEYARRNLDSLTNIIDRVVAFVKTSNEGYDQRWLNLSGMGAFNETGNNALSLPQKDWPAIKEKTIDTYYNGFKAALAGLRARR